MHTGFIVIGILAIVYYLFICYYTRKWNSTFAAFWIVFAVFNFLLAAIVHFSPRWLQYILLTLNFIAYFVFFAVQVIICSAMLTLPPKKLDVIIVLGAQVRGKKITNSLKRRLDRGVAYLKENPETRVVVSGGQGKGEDVTEAFAMAQYLVSHGIAEEQISLEEKSRKTYENLKYSALLVDSMDDRIGIVSNNFHIYRSLLLGRQIGYTRLYGIAAGCNPILFLNYMVREFFAVMRMYLTKE